MTINWTLNGDEITVTTDAGVRLLDLLRRNYHLTGVKAGCAMGCCGACIVKMNGAVVSSCLIPAFNLRNAEIITIEGFKKLEEYNDIMEGFDAAHCRPCEHCFSGKVFIADMLIDRKDAPERREILSAFDGIKCRCTESEALVEGVVRAFEIRERRLYGRT